MAQSISSAQANFLSSGKLDELGSTGEFAPRESLSALIKLAGMIIESTQTNLQSSGQNSSGALSDSFHVVNPTESKGAIKLDIKALDYYDFQNKGVRGTAGGGSSANYNFKNNFPSEAMVTSIEAWIKRGGASTANVSKAHTISGQETKNKTISEYEHAYAVARSIKIHGIKGTGYFDKAIKLAQAYALDVLGKALLVDVTSSLPKKLNNGNSNK